MRVTIEGHLADIDYGPYINAEKDAPTFFAAFGPYVQQAFLKLTFDSKIDLRQTGRAWDSNVKRHRVYIHIEEVPDG